MQGRNTPYDQDDRGSPTAVILVAGLVIGSCLALGLAMFAASKAGAVTRPDYQALGRCAPDVTVHHDGDHVYTVPVDCPPMRWHQATFDLAPFGGRHQADGQQLVCDVTFTIADGEATDVAFRTDTAGGCVAASLLNDPPGTFIAHTPLGTCGTQQDSWLDLADQPYASWVEETDGCLAPAATATPVTVPPPAPVNENVSAAQGPAPAADASSSGGQETSTSPPGSAPVPAATPTLAVAGVRAELPATGWAATALIVIAVWFVVAGIVVMTLGWTARRRKDGES